MVGLAVVIVAGLAAILISQSSGDSGAARDQLYGIASGAPLNEADLKKMAVSKVSSVRLVFSWSTIESDRGSYDWKGSDDAIGSLAAHGIEAVPFVYGSPSFVTPVPTTPPIDTGADREAWVAFLKAAVERYGPGGEYWADGYKQQFGADAPSVPVTAWQIWNEPNLPHYFTSDSPVSDYAELLKLAHDAITEEDPSAEIVLAGMPGYGKPDTAWKFLDELYRQPGFQGSFDAVALHPYARTVDQLRLEIEKLRSAMADHGDESVPLWLTELGWGSGKPNRFGLNKGLKGQAQLLDGAFQLVEDHRGEWHVQRLFWFDWRDPPPGTPQSCSFCSSAGLIQYSGFPKPSWTAYTKFSAEAAE